MTVLGAGNGTFHQQQLTLGVDTRLGTPGLGLASAAGDTTTVGAWTGLLPKNTKSRLADVTDGLSNTIGFAESFLSGGVANYLGTYWPVGDEAGE